MPSNSNKLSKFWLELKRRNVVRVIAMYAGAAFIVLEVSDIVLPRLGLPEWTVTFAIILLIVGFPIIIILSWIFDITPDGVKKTGAISDTETEISPEISQRKLKVSDVIISVLVVVIGVLIYPKIFNKDPFADLRDEDGRISIAVMPFENLTGDTTLNWIQRGVPSMIINGLGNSPELAVSDEHTISDVMVSLGQSFTAAISLPRAREVAERAQAETYVSGSYLGGGDTYWILANLVDTESGTIIWTEKIEGNLESSDYLVLADSLCKQIKNYLEIQVLKKNLDYDFRELFPESAEAYKYYIEGMNRFLVRDHKSAIVFLEKALAIDSTFTIASFYLAWNYYWDHQYTPGNKWMLKAIAGKDGLPLHYQHWLDMWHAYFVSKNGDEIIRYCDLLMESGIESRMIWMDLAGTYQDLDYQPGRTIRAFEKVEELSKQRGGPWKFEPYYIRYGKALHEAGKHEKENELYETGLSIFPLSLGIRRGRAGCTLSRGDTSYFSSFLADLKSEGWNDIFLMDEEAFIYEWAKLYNESAEILRELHRIMPDEQFGMMHLAKILIEDEVNVEEGIEMTDKLLAGFILYNGLEVMEGMDLFDQVLEIEMQDFIAVFMGNVFYLKGLGLHKQGKDKEALKYLEVALELYPFYRRTPILTLKEVRQALSI